MRYLLLIIFLFAGCSFRPVPPPHTDNKDIIIQKYEEKIKAAEEKQQNAKNDLDKLKAEKEELKAIRDKHLAEAKILDSEIKAKEKEIVQERQNMIKVKLYWLAGICLFGAALAFGLSFWLPMFRTKALTFAVTLVGIAATAWFIAWLVPYLMWIGLSIVVLGIIMGIVYWVREHKGLEEVVSAVEPVKEQIPNYKDHFRKYVSKKSDNLINKIRDIKKRTEDKIKTTIIKKDSK